MKSFDTISEKMRFQLLLLLIVIFSILSGITFLHTVNSITEHRDFEKSIEIHFARLHELDHSLQAIIQTESNSSATYTSKIQQLQNSIASFQNDISALKEKQLFIKDTVFQNQVTNVEFQIKTLSAYVVNDLSQIYENSKESNIFSIHKKYIDPLIESRTAIRTYVYKIGFAQQRKYSINLFIILFVSILAIILSIVIYTINTNANLHQLHSFVQILENGGKPDKINLFSGLEFQEISECLNKFLDHQDEKIQYLKTIGKGESPKRYKPNDSDLLGNEIKIMAERLSLVQREENLRLKEEQKRVWISEGIAQFSEILRSEREDVKELSFTIIQKLVSYLKVEMGTLFLASDEEEDYLNTIASYAFDRRKYLNKSFRFGEGLPGTCALEKEKIYIDDVPENYSDVISGVGQAKPRYLLFVPMKIENEIFGILELGSFRALHIHELDFVDQIAESIASTLLGVKTNERTALLLRQSQEQAEMLRQQEEKMIINVKELERTQEKSRENELERSEMLHSMNQSSLVAEYGINGKFTEINDKYLELLESPREQIIGKHHNEFAIIDRYSEEYKEFWQKLKKGETISKEEKFKLYSGKEIWLQQSYTPIKNNDNHIFKILNIATDISTEKKLQEQLNAQHAEISRRDLAFKSLNKAVDNSIIRCELDDEGLILDVNNNYENITGYNRKELLGRNYAMFLRDMEKEQYEKIREQLLKGKTFEGAIRRTKPTDEEIWLMSTFSPVKDEEGSIYKIYILALDITEKKLKYQLLEKANKEIERLKEILRAYE